MPRCWNNPPQQLYFLGILALAMFPRNAAKRRSSHSASSILHNDGPMTEQPRRSEPVVNTSDRAEAAGSSVKFRNKGGSCGVCGETPLKGTNCQHPECNQTPISVEGREMMNSEEPDTTSTKGPTANDNVDNITIKDSGPPDDKPPEEQYSQVAPAMTWTSWKKFLLILASLVQMLFLTPSILWVSLWVLEKVGLGHMAFFFIGHLLFISALVLVFVADKSFRDLMRVEVEALKVAVGALVGHLNRSL